MRKVFNNRQRAVAGSVVEQNGPERCWRRLWGCFFRNVGVGQLQQGGAAAWSNVSKEMVLVVQNSNPTKIQQPLQQAEDDGAFGHVFERRHFAND